MLEGHWRQTQDAVDDLPWPQPGPGWTDRSAVLEALKRVEARAEVFAAAGFSRCRLCGQPNGSRAYSLGEWVWPDGFRHYIADHGVRPTAAFEAFLLGDA